MAYSFNSPRSVSTLPSFASLTMMSSFSTLTYGGSLYLQKNTRISLDNVSGRFCSRRLIFRSATHWTSGADEMSVTGISFVCRCRTELKRTKWRSHLFCQVLDQILPLNQLHMDHDDLQVSCVLPGDFEIWLAHLDCAENDRRVVVLKLRQDPLADLLRFGRILRFVSRQSRQYSDPTPLRTFI